MPSCAEEERRLKTAEEQLQAERAKSQALAEAGWGGEAKVVAGLACFDGFCSEVGFQELQRAQRAVAEAEHLRSERTHDAVEPGTEDGCPIPSMLPKSCHPRRSMRLRSRSYVWWIV